MTDLLPVKGEGRAILIALARCGILTMMGFPVVFGALLATFDCFYGPPTSNVSDGAWRRGRGAAFTTESTEDTEHNKINLRDLRALRGEFGAGAEWVSDDAGRTCRARELAIVELRVQTGTNTHGGHVFISTPNRTVGFRTENAAVSPYDYVNPFARPARGIILDDLYRPFDRRVRYSVSPVTLRRLEAGIDLHAHDGYQLGNWSGGRNCATWVRDRLCDAGLVPPPGDCPNRMARYMDVVPRTNDRQLVGSAVRTSCLQTLYHRWVAQLGNLCHGCRCRRPDLYSIVYSVSLCLCGYSVQWHGQ